MEFSKPVKIAFNVSWQGIWNWDQFLLRYKRWSTSSKSFVNFKQSKWNITGYCLQFNLIKKESGPYWPRLTQEEKKWNHISVDWSKYIDEDDEEEEGTKGLNDWDPDNMKGIIEYYLSNNNKVSTTILMTLIIQVTLLNQVCFSLDELKVSR